MKQNAFIKKHIYSRIEALFAGRISPVNLERMRNAPGLLNLSGERRVVTILYLEPRRSTFAHEALTPEQWSQYLNTYLTLVTDVIHEIGGMVLGYEGTKVTACWGAPLKSNDAALNACRAVLLIKEQLTRLNEDLADRELPDILPLFALSTEEVFAGDYGSEQMPQYSLLGDYRYIHHAMIKLCYDSSTNILVTEHTRKAAGDGFDFQPLVETVRKKGFTEFIPIYELKGERHAD
ncbi:MAG: adenylate/guanylate cyclase domain-containing protein [Gammaproteobacteria bacterium]|nr:MAG: adenylate/guanylate cyclase domain-containing protein [Gammaproteobacteria bacterium]